jgi:hypothetical protein
MHLKRVHDGDTMPISSKNRKMPLKPELLIESIIESDAENMMGFSLLHSRKTLNEYFL